MWHLSVYSEIINYPRKGYGRDKYGEQLSVNHLSWPLPGPCKTCRERERSIRVTGLEESGWLL